MTKFSFTQDNCGVSIDFNEGLLDRLVLQHTSFTPTQIKALADFYQSITGRPANTIKATQEGN